MRPHVLDPSELPNRVCLADGRPWPCRTALRFEIEQDERNHRLLTIAVLLGMASIGLWISFPGLPYYALGIFVTVAALLIVDRR